MCGRLRSHGRIASTERPEGAHLSSAVHIFKGSLLVYVKFTNLGSYVRKVRAFVCFRGQYPFIVSKNTAKMVVYGFGHLGNLQISRNDLQM